MGAGEPRRLRSFSRSWTKWGGQNRPELLVRVLLQLSAIKVDVACSDGPVLRGWTMSITRRGFLKATGIGTTIALVQFLSIHSEGRRPCSSRATRRASKVAGNS